MRCIGVDPGSRDGAAVILEPDGKTVTDWCTWVWLERKSGGVYRFTYNSHIPGLVTNRNHFLTLTGGLEFLDIGTAEPGLNPQLVIEGLYIDTSGKVKIQAMLKLAESVGEARAALRQTTCPILRPQARVWRPNVAGISGRMKKDAAEARAVALAPKLFTWKGGWPGDQLNKTERGALAEAACIARYGVTQRKYDPGLRAWFKEHA